LFFTITTFAQNVKSNIPYVENGHARHVLDIYAPANAKNLPVVFWIHGGGWQQGDKSTCETQAAVVHGQAASSSSPRTTACCRRWTWARSSATAPKSFAWVQKHIAAARRRSEARARGRALGWSTTRGDHLHRRPLLEGESALDFDALIGCVPVDGDTYDIPAMIETAETRAARAWHSDAVVRASLESSAIPPLHKDFSAVTHVAKGKGIPPFLILHVASVPTLRFPGAALRQCAAGGRRAAVTIFGAKDTDHVKLNDDLGLPDDPATKALTEFVDEGAEEVMRVTSLRKAAV
jgi:arylformamidase